MLNARLCLLILLCSLFAPACAASSNVIVAGNARFTLITPNCIRLEYSPNGQFVDAPSLFAATRRVTGTPAANPAGVIVETGAIKLTYTPNGQPFSADNLHAVIKRGTQTITWTPGMPNPGNLGGTIRTLDGVRGPVDLGQGLVSRDGWFLLDDSQTPLLTRNWVQSRPVVAGRTDWYLFGYGDNYRAALKSLAVIGGPVPLPRKYTLGAWYSRYWPFSSGDYHQIINEYGQHGFPLDNIVMDMDWHRDGWTGWSWNRTLLPDAEALLPWFHSQGLHVTLNLHPADGVGPQEDQYAAFMHDMGADPGTKQTLPFDAADPKYMHALFSDVFAPLEKDGVDFWWLDWQQGPYTRSVPDLTNLFWLNTLLYDHTAQNGQRGVSFSRWAGWGDHRHPIHFSGDADAGFPMLAFEVPFTATAGNAGCFFWSHDIGGHNGGRNEESYTRWVQFGAVSPVLRSHSSRDAATDRRPWNYPAWAENSMRVSFHLRDQLFPYIYTSAAQSARETVPLDRPLYFDYPKEENAYHNGQEFLLGDSLLAAPIVSAGVGPGRVGTQTVWFPPGSAWYNFFTHERFTGGTKKLVAADINEFPLYAKGGVPIPMQPYTPRMATTPLLHLRVRCYPGPDGITGRSTLYEDDGVSTGYKHGQFAVTPLSYTRRGSFVTVKIGAVRGHYAGQPAQRRFTLEMPGVGGVEHVLIDGRPARFVAQNVRINGVTIGVSTRPLSQPTTVVLTAVPGEGMLNTLARNQRIEAITGSYAPSVEAALADPSLTPAQQETLLAVAGIGLVAHNESPTLYHGTVQDYFYSPAGTVTRVVTPTMKWRGRTVSLPGQAAFSFGGRSYHLPLGTQTDAILSLDNVARSAKVTASGVENSYGVEGAVDGIAGGYPDNKANEWSAGSKVGASLTLTWDTPQTVDHVSLYDRPNTNDQVTAGALTFSDGSMLTFGALPDDGKTPLVLRFPSKTITSLTFTVAAVKASTENAGLSEIAVYRAK